MTLLRHPYTGLYWTEEYIERYPALDEDAMSLEEATYELVNDRGFQVVRLEDIEPEPHVSLIRPHPYR